MRIHRLAVAAILLCVCTLIPSCSEKSDSQDQRVGRKTTITIAAAASLKDVFDAVEVEFLKEHPNITVQFNYAASNLLARQVEQGAPFDVIAFAAEEPMNEIDSAGLLLSGSRRIFARNRLCLIIRNSSAQTPSTLSDLMDPRYTRIAVGSPGVPVRTYTEDALRKSDLWEKLESRFVYGANVRQVLDYVETGEADCGFVYASDARISKVRIAITIDSTLYRPILYPVAALQRSSVQAEASAFLSYLESEKGKRLLREYGFER